MTDNPKIDPTYEAVIGIKQDVAVLKVHVEANTKDLAEHIKGVKSANVRIERLEKFDMFLKGIWASFGGLAVVASILYAISRLYKS